MSNFFMWSPEYIHHFHCNKHSVYQTDKTIRLKIPVPPFTFFVNLSSSYKREEDKITKLINPGGIQLLECSGTQNHLYVFPSEVIEFFLGIHELVILLLFYIIQVVFLVPTMTHMSYVYWSKNIFIFACVPDFPFAFLLLFWNCISSVT